MNTKAIIPISDSSDLGRRPTTEDIPSEIGKNVRDWKTRPRLENYEKKCFDLLPFVFV